MSFFFLKKTSHKHVNKKFVKLIY